MHRYIIVDDEALIRRGTIKKLSGLSDRITCVGEAENGEEGIRLAETLHPDFAIVDMQMPKMGGMELLPYFSEHFPDMAIIVISAYQDFQYVKRAMESRAVTYMVKPFSRESIQSEVLKILDTMNEKSHAEDELQKRVQETENAFYELDLQYLKDRLLNAAAANHDFSSKRMQYLNGTHAFVLYSLYFSAAADVSEWEGQLQNMLHTLEESHHCILLHHDSMPQFLFLLDMWEGSIHRPHSAERACRELLSSILSPGNTAVSISQVCTDITRLYFVNDENLKRLDDRHYVRDMLFVEPETAWPASPQIIWEKEEEFLFRVETGEQRTVSALLQDLFASFYRGSVSLLEAKQYCELLSSKCRVLMYDYIYPGKNGENSKTMQGIVRSLYSFEDLYRYYDRFFTNVTGMIGSGSIYEGLSVVEKVKVYIDKNYQKNITQDLLASYFYINRSYLSTVFRQQEGVKFADYLNNVRLEKARQLLIDTDLKLYRIAKMTGYSNPKYFFRIFKQKVGMTPDEYRLHHRNI